LIASHEGETGTYEEAREKHWMNLTFTLFNRLAAKVMEATSIVFTNSYQTSRTRWPFFWS
jgi:hypothetical protein